MSKYWSTSGFDTLKINSDRHLEVTDDFLRTYLARPELNIVSQSCDQERAIHERLLQNPRLQMIDEEIDGIADPDVQTNYRIWFRYRTKLLAASSLEHFYMNLFQGDGVDVPPLFVSQLTQIFLQHILGETPDPYELRLAEFFFRTQKVSTLEDGVLMAADYETIERNAQASEFGNIVDLLKNQSLAARTIDLDVLHPDNAKSYWGRDESFDFAVQLNFDQPALPTLARLLERWIGHFLGIETSISPMREISDPKWVWHVGLDASATEILNGLYQEKSLDETVLNRLICLFRLEFNDASPVISQVRGKPVYLGLAMNEDGLIKLKPQNLLFNLPLSPVS